MVLSLPLLFPGFLALVVSVHVLCALSTNSGGSARSVLIACFEDVRT